MVISDWKKLFIMCMIERKMVMRYIHTLFIILLILVLSGCNNSVINSQGAELEEGQNQESEATQDTQSINDECPEIIDTSGEKSILVGTWYHNSAIGSVLGSRYHFYEDGRYIFEYSQYDEAKRVLSESGMWSFENNILTLVINSKVTVEGGEKTEAFFESEYAIKNGTIKIVEVNPPETNEYTLDEFLQDTEESPGFWKVDINGSSYWKFTDNPDMYLNEPVEDGDSYSA